MAHLLCRLLFLHFCRELSKYRHLLPILLPFQVRHLFLTISLTTIPVGSDSLLGSCSHKQRVLRHSTWMFSVLSSSQRTRHNQEVLSQLTIYAKKLTPLLQIKFLPQAIKSLLWRNENFMFFVFYMLLSTINPMKKKIMPVNFKNLFCCCCCCDRVECTTVSHPVELIDR